MTHWKGWKKFHLEIRGNDYGGQILQRLGQKSKAVLYSRITPLITTTKFKKNNILIFVPGVDVMITIFCDFWQFSAKKLAFSSKTNVMIKILHNLALFWVKNTNFFRRKIRQKYLKNHNIGPRLIIQEVRSKMIH
jgi:hypothetical protein